MKLIGWIVAGCIALAALRAAIAIIVAIYLALLLLSLILHPHETLGILGFWFLCAMLDCYPLITIGILVGLYLLARRRRLSRLRSTS